MTTVEKRVLDIKEPCKNASFILLDIEGTTTSIKFVKGTLIPFVRKNLESYLKEQWETEELKKIVGGLKEQADGLEGAVDLGAEEDVEKVQAALVKSVLRQMDNSPKSKELVTLQGYIYRQGYKSGEFKGHLYPDVAPMLREWHASGKKIYIFSSGSVEAQKLLFGHSTEGDLLELLSGHFASSEVGSKYEADTYKNIAEKMGAKPEEVAFFTDLITEAEAAKSAGMTAVLMAREGNAALTEESRASFTVLEGFELTATEEEERPAKKMKLAEEEETKVEETKAEETKSEEVEMKEEGTEEKKEVEQEQEKPVEESKPEDVAPKVEEEPKASEEVPEKTKEMSEEGDKTNGHTNGHVNGHSNGTNGDTNGDATKAEEPKDEMKTASPVKKVVTETPEEMKEEESPVVTTE